MGTGGQARFELAAEHLGVTVQATNYPAGTRTADDAAAAIGCDVAQIVKSLVFVADGRPILALTSGANRVDPDRLATAAGATTVVQADADTVRAATGYAIGGTPPFGHETPLATYVDEDLLGYDTVWAAAGTPATCFPIAPADLLAAAEATTAAFAAR